uniref:Short-chain collagen C4-like n=1 Tax=Branchiostoma floridae TaxID=7739 RepID=C3YI44_BRAFL|eukprot:XP_002604170.1 hypothetical protein BRAFLDRAFT_73487 [Branchiostoma floridae]
MMAVRVVVVFALAIVAHGNVLQDETVDGLLGEASAGVHHLFDSLDDSAGIMAGSWYSHSGSGSNFLCLPEDPEWMEYSDATDGQRGFVAGAEYETDRNAPFAIHDQHDAPCAVCAIPRGTSLMIPAKMSCPTGWIQEYSGYLMAAKYSHRRTDFVCVDVEAQHEDGGDANNNGALLYLVEGRCNYNLPCPPYVNGRELTCVVCSAGVKPVTT